MRVQVLHWIPSDNYSTCHLRPAHVASLKAEFPCVNLRSAGRCVTCLVVGRCVRTTVWPWPLQVKNLRTAWKHVIICFVTSMKFNRDACSANFIWSKSVASVRVYFSKPSILDRLMPFNAWCLGRRLSAAAAAAWWSAAQSSHLNSHWPVDNNDCLTAKSYFI